MDGKQTHYFSWTPVYIRKILKMSFCFGQKDYFSLASCFASPTVMKMLFTQQTFPDHS